MTLYHAFSVPKKDVQKTRRLLEEKSLINAHVKIRADVDEQAVDRLLVLTNQFQQHGEASEGGGEMSKVCSELLSLGVDFRLCWFDQGDGDYIIPEPKNGVSRAVKKALKMLPAEIVERSRCQDGGMFDGSKLSYAIYSPMLLFSASSFASSGLSLIVQSLQNLPIHRNHFFESICQSLKVTRVAVNAPIAALNGATSSTPQSNTLRSPTQLQPLHGDFGLNLPAFPEHVPTSTDFEKAFWVSCRQNGITQMWAPHYTMFSQGNVTEKARLLHLPSVRNAVDYRLGESVGCAAADLCAGIGYFGFSYAKAGVEKVFCWDLNPWSVEGLRRGAAANAWGCIIKTSAQESVGSLNEGVLEGIMSERVRLVAFCESNVNALARLEEIRSHCEGSMLPIRHVNAGMLPSAAMAWHTAVLLIDKSFGGWIHLHESVLHDRLQIRVDQMVAAVTEVWRKAVESTDGESSAETPALEHVEKVKSMGPRLVHIVLDIWIPPRS